MTYTHTGRIIKMTGGLYTVRLDPAGEALGGTPAETPAESDESPLAGHIVDCRARGNFRHEHTPPWWEIGCCCSTTIPPIRRRTGGR